MVGKPRFGFGEGLRMLGDWEVAAEMFNVHAGKGTVACTASMFNRIARKISLLHLNPAE